LINIRCATSILGICYGAETSHKNNMVPAPEKISLTKEIGKSRTELNNSA